MTPQQRYRQRVKEKRVYLLCSCGRKVYRSITTKNRSCPRCGAAMRETTRLPGGQPSGKPHRVCVRLTTETFAWLSARGPLASAASDVLERARAEAGVA